ncbi:unnamed protein product [Blepharisma stoltei]|uniref:Protein kinase domain-containing protein n=1 Tax=Blepharisma stoltei TaxID=1481888 RepID=A0AAU9J7X0_9CILI|nr:unnamed protein product [Blepharisma stoltei]
MDDETYSIILFVMALLYAIIFCWSVTRAEKMNSIIQGWRPTKFFYIAILVQSFVRFCTFAILTWVFPRRKVSQTILFILFSIPDCIFLVTFTLLVLQMISIFYYSHKENDLQMVLLVEFTLPKHHQAQKLIGAGIVLWLVFQGVLYSLLFSEILYDKYVQIELAILNVLSASSVLLLLLYLVITYSRTPFDSESSKSNLIKTTMIVLFWTFGRYMKGIIDLMDGYSDFDVLSEFTNIKDDRFVATVLTVTSWLTSEIFCYVLVLQYRFVGILSKDNDGSSSGISLQPQKNVGEYSNTEYLLEESTEISAPTFNTMKIMIKEKFASRSNGLGELYKCVYKRLELAYRKIEFPRISAYVLEEVNAEIEALKLMNAKYFVPIYGLNNLNPTLGIVMEYYPNGSLYHALHEQNIVFSLQECFNIISAVAQGVREIHSNNKVHGHLSSHNILLDQQNNPKISDLGMAKFKKYAGVVKGYSNKSPWSSPEILRDPSQTTNKVTIYDDIYSFGIILWEIFSNKIPFEGLCFEDLQRKIGHEGLKPEISDNFPSEFIKIIEMCWDIIPEKRPKFKEICLMLKRAVTTNN